MKKAFQVFLVLLIACNLYAQKSGDTIRLADPTIFYNDGNYYLYGTGGKDGFLVYHSNDLVNWSGPAGVNDGYALVKGETFGTKGFWAPQIIKYNQKFYMAYTANEHIAIAESNSLVGPFRQQRHDSLPAAVKQIDPFIFTDDDGKKYLYHVRLENGNRIFVGQMKNDFSGIEESTLKECISGQGLWENTDNSKWPVTEGPTVLKHNGLYYMLYSANDFRNVNYAVGYATATNPFGPWTKYKGNPIISKQNIQHNGTGHGDLLQDKNGNWYYVLHTHASANTVSPRLTGIVPLSFVKEERGGPDKIIIDSARFHYLQIK